MKEIINKVPYIAKNGVFDDLSETRLGWWTKWFLGRYDVAVVSGATKEPIIKRLQKNLEKKMDSVTGF